MNQLNRFCDSRSKRIGLNRFERSITHIGESLLSDMSSVWSTKPAEIKKKIKNFNKWLDILNVIENK